MMADNEKTGTPSKINKSPTVAEADSSAISTSGLDDGDQDALHSVGMFLAGDAERVELDDVVLPPELAEPSFAEQSRNVLSWIILVICIGAAVGGVLYINNTEELKIQVEYLFRGGLEQHKRAHIIELQERFQKEDHYAQNRYGEFRMMYSPRDAEVSVTLIKYKEKITDFMTRHVRGTGDTRQRAEVRELKKFRQLTGNLKEHQVVAEQDIKDLPVTSRTNPKDKAEPSRPKACTDDPEDYCTFVYRIKISKEKYRPREFVVFSEYSLEPPDMLGCSVPGSNPETCFDEKKVQQLLFKNTGPGIFEVMWPGADLQPTPELFQEKFIRVLTDRVKCKLGPEDYTRMDLKDYAALEALPEDQRWQKLSENGLLSHGPPAAKVWTLMEWKASVAELRQPENIHLWNSALETIGNCKCEDGVKCWGAPAAPEGAAPAPK